MVIECSRLVSVVKPATRWGRGFRARPVVLAMSGRSMACSFRPAAAMLTSSALLYGICIIGLGILLANTHFTGVRA
jgi:hypothetical protein